jgi:hypothetical protein
MALDRFDGVAHQRRHRGRAETLADHTECRAEAVGRPVGVARLRGLAARHVAHQNAVMRRRCVAVADRGDLDRDLGAEVAFQRGGEHADHAMALHAGEQIGLRSGRREPLAEPLADDRGLDGGLRQVEEGAVGAADDAVLIQHHVAVGHPLDQSGQRRRAVLARHGARANRLELQQEGGAGFGGQQRGTHRPGGARRTDMHEDAGRSTMLAYAAEHGAQLVMVAGEDVAQHVAALGEAERADRGHVDFGDAQGVGADDDDGLVGGVEQQPVARLDLAQLPVFLLARLLCGDQLGLQFGHGLQVLADGHEAGASGDAGRGVFDRQFAAAGEALGDLAEGGDAGGAGVGDHAADAVAADFANRLEPGAADPAGHALAGDAVGEGGGVDHTIIVEDQRDIGLSNADGDHGRGWPSRFSRFLGRPSVARRRAVVPVIHIYTIRRR